MGMKYFDINGVSAGSVTLTATDGTPRNTVTTDVECAQYEVVPYLYSAISPDYAPVSGNVIDVSEDSKYIEITVTKNGEAVSSSDINSAHVYAIPYMGDGITDMLETTIQMGVTGPHGGQVYEIRTDLSLSYGLADFGDVRVDVEIQLGGSYFVLYNRDYVFTRTHAISSVTINEGNNYSLAWYDPAGDASLYIPCTFTQATSDSYEMNKLMAKWVDNAPEENPIMWVYDYVSNGYINGVREDARAGAGVIDVAYFNGTAIAHAQCNTTAQQALTLTSDQASYTGNVGSSNPVHITGTYTPTNIPVSDIEDRIILAKPEGMSIVSDISFSNGTFEFDTYSTVRMTGEVTISMAMGPDPTSPTGEYPILTIPVTFAGEGFEVGSFESFMPAGASQTVTYKAYDENNDVILTQSTVTASGTGVSISQHTFNSTTGEGSFKINTTERKFDSFDISLTNGTISTTLTCQPEEGIVSLQITTSDASFTMTENEQQKIIRFQVYPESVSKETMLNQLSVALTYGGEEQNINYEILDAYADGRGYIAIERGWGDQQITNGMLVLYNNAWRSASAQKRFSIVPAQGAVGPDDRQFSDYIGPDKQAGTELFYFSPISAFPNPSKFTVQGVGNITTTIVSISSSSDPGQITVRWEAMAGEQIYSNPEIQIYYDNVLVCTYYIYRARLATTVTFADNSTYTAYDNQGYTDKTVSVPASGTYDLDIYVVHTDVNHNEISEARRYLPSTGEVSIYSNTQQAITTSMITNNYTSDGTGTGRLTANSSSGSSNITVGSYGEARPDSDSKIFFEAEIA